MDKQQEFRHRSNGVFRVIVTDPNKKIPGVTLEYAKQCQKEVALHIEDPEAVVRFVDALEWAKVSQGSGPEVSYKELNAEEIKAIFG